MLRFKAWVRPVLVVAALLTASAAFATNGYFTHGTGSKNKAMAGAGIALPQDAVDTVNNPAVAVLVGNQMEVGLSIFSPHRSYRTSASDYLGHYPAFTIGPNDITSDSNYFFIPHFARSWQLGEGRAFAVSFYGRGGMSTDWKGGYASFDPDGPGPGGPVTLPGTYGAGDAGVDLSQGFIDLTWAWQINDRLSLGVAPVLAFQIFEITGVGTFAGFTETFWASNGQQMPTHLSNNGHEFSYGAGLKVGLHSKLSDQFSLGLSYQSRIYMTPFDRYADLFAEHGDFDIPSNFKIGLTWMVQDNVAVSFDIEHTWFSEIDSVGNSIERIFSCPPFGNTLTNCLGGDTGAGFGWEDMTTYKVGVQWGNGGDWTWRAGYSYGDMPIPTSQMTFNILAPATIEDTFTFGFTRAVSDTGEWNVALMYAPKKSRTGPNNFDPSQTITWDMYQYELEVSYGWKF